MAWLVGDGFDHYANWTTDMAANADVWQAIANCVGVQTGRFTGSSAINLGNASVTPGTAQTITFANSTTIWVNYNEILNATTIGSAGTHVGFRLLDGASNQMGFWFNSNGTFFVTNGLDSGTVLATSPQLVPNGTCPWHNCQVKVVINNTIGSVELRLNGATSPSWNATGLNTRNGTATNQCNSIILASNSASTGFMDDFYAFNDQGSQPNTWQGEVKCATLFPNSDNSIQWTRNAGSTNFSRVNQVGSAQDNDTSYNSDNTVGHIDQFLITSLGVTPAAIVAVQTKMNHRMDDVGPHTVQMNLTSGGTTVNKTATVGASYVWATKTDVVDPNTSAAWTASGVNSAKPGYQVVT
jgi:hypothetical protein